MVVVYSWDKNLKNNSMELIINLTKEFDDLKMFIKDEIRRALGGVNVRNGREKVSDNSKEKAATKSNGSDLSIDELAKKFKVSKFTAYNWIKTNGLKSYKDGRNIMIRDSDLNVFFSKNKNISKRASKRLAGKKRGPKPRKNKELLL